MKRPGIAIASAFSLLFAQPAGAQSNVDLAKRSVGQAVSNTLDAWAKNNANVTCIGRYAECWADAQAAFAQMMQTNPSWLAAAMLYANKGVKAGSGYKCTGTYCGGDFGGGGATGDWVYDPSCGQWKLSSDADGWLIVPSIKLPGGRPTKVDQSPTYYTSPSNGYANYAADTAGAAVFWSVHLRNQGREQADWIGIYSWNGSQAGLSSISRWKNGVKTGHVNDNPYSVDASQGSGCCGYYSKWFNSNQIDCPQSEQGGGADKDFYPQTGGSSYIYTQCTEYVKNFGLSSTGYAVADLTAIPASYFATYAANYESINKCVIDKELIRQIADAVRKQAYPNATPVATRDVRTGGYDPQGKDMADQTGTALPPPTSGNTPSTPGAVPTPSPSPTGGSSGGGGDTSTPPPAAESPGAEAPDLIAPTLSTTDWFPSLSLELGSPSCPTYEFEAFDQTYTLDSHCPFIETNRALISMLMIIIFTMAAVRVILST